VEKAHQSFVQLHQILNMITDIPTRALALREIAIVQAQSGLVEEARRTFAQIHETISSIGWKWNRRILAPLATAHAQDGKTEEAYHLANLIQDQEEEADVLVAIAQSHLMTGRDKEADQMLEKAELLMTGRDAELLYKTNLSEIKLRNIRFFRHKPWHYHTDKTRDDLLRVIAEAQLRSGHFDDILQIAADIEKDSKREGLLQVIAIERARAQDFKEAIQATTAMEWDWWRIETLRIIAKIAIDELISLRRIELVRSLVDIAISSPVI
jgi:tetratricopeptide (TPR) repeat protein